MKLLQKKEKIYSLFSNIANSRRHVKLFYVTDMANWSTKWDATYLVDSLDNRIKGIITFLPFALKNKIIHFGSAGTFLKFDCLKRFYKCNKIIVTWFHVDEGRKDNNILIKKINSEVDLLHTSCDITKEKLIRMGIDSKKIVVIPIGIDLNVFKKFSLKERNEIKGKLKLSKKKIIVGSFQKDGNGWGEGLTPKKIKGPDVFCDVIKKLSNVYDIHVLLTGPARGYVKKRLDEIGVSYTHKFLDNYLDIVDYYNALDLYLVTSRAEGGPKAILECMACEIPFVSTNVGMANDIFPKNNGFVAGVEDVDDIFEKSKRILDDCEWKDKIVKNNRNAISKFSWNEIAKQYYDKIYARFLEKV